MFNQTWQGCSEQIGLEAQDFPRTYLARHELDSAIINIVMFISLMVCRLNWSEVKPRTQCRLEPSYIPVGRSHYHRSSSDKAAEQEAASPMSSSKKAHARCALLLQHHHVESVEC